MTGLNPGIGSFIAPWASPLSYISDRRYPGISARYETVANQTATADRLYLLPPWIVQENVTFTKILMQETAGGGAGASGSARVGLYNATTLALVQQVGNITFSAGAAIRETGSLTITLTKGQKLRVGVNPSAAIKFLGMRLGHYAEYQAVNLPIALEHGLPSYVTTFDTSASVNGLNTEQQTFTYTGSTLPNPAVPTSEDGSVMPLVMFEK